MSDFSTCVLHVSLNPARQPRHLAALQRFLIGESGSVAILRGRLTPEEAWYDVQLLGSTRRVEAMLERMRELGLKVHSVPRTIPIGSRSSPWNSGTSATPVRRQEGMSPAARAASAAEASRR